MARKAISLSKRFRVFHRDRFSCVYCSAHGRDVELQLDHKKPVALGGTNAFDNLVTACFDCNMGKSDMAIEADYLATPDEVEGEDYEIVGWEEAQWRISMLAETFERRDEGLFLDMVSGDAGVEGYVSLKNLDPVSARFLNGAHIVGLIDRMYAKSLFRIDEEGTHAHFRIRPIGPLEIANCFNRFGTLRLSHWSNVRACPSVAEIYGQ